MKLLLSGSTKVILHRSLLTEVSQVGDFSVSVVTVNDIFRTPPLLLVLTQHSMLQGQLLLIDSQWLSEVCGG